MSFAIVDVAKSSVICRAIKDLSVDPLYQGQVCLDLQINAQAMTREKNEQRYIAINDGMLYFGAHLGKDLSLHIRKRAVWKEGFDRGGIDTYSLGEDGAYVQLGGLAYKQWRLIIGKFQPPIGLNTTTVPIIFKYLYNDGRMWRTPEQSIGVSWRDKSRTRLDIYYASALDYSEDDLALGYSRDISIIKLIHDITASGRMRFILTYGLESPYGRRYGFSVLNINRSGKTFFEWLRRRYRNHRGPYAFDQIIRLGHAAAFKRGGRVVVEYEDDVEKYYLTILGHDSQITEKFITRIAFGYYRSRFKQIDNHWLGVVGVDYQL